MRSFSIHVGRLFGVEVRLHLTFLILPLFVFWTEYNARHMPNGPRDLALVGIVLACVAFAVHSCTTSPSRTYRRRVENSMSGQVRKIAAM